MCSTKKVLFSLLVDAYSKYWFAESLRNHEYPCHICSGMECVDCLTCSKCHCLVSFLGPAANVSLANTASAHSLCAEDLTTTPVLTGRGRILLCLLSWLQQNLFLINRIYMCCLYSVATFQDDCDAMVYGLASKHFGISNLYLQLSVAVMALGNPANRERKVSVLPAGGIAAKEACVFFVPTLVFMSLIYIVACIPPCSPTKNFKKWSVQHQVGNPHSCY